MSTHVASLCNGPSVFENELGSISQLDTSSLPILSGLSIKRIVLGPGAIREPQWNVNANQIAYVTSGTVLVSMLGNADEFASFVVRAGQMYHVESGAIYHIEVLGDEDINFLIFFDQPTPGDIGYRATASAFSRGVLSASFGVPERDLPHFPFTPIDPLIVSRINPIDRQH
jgi:oxalate decarboxylase